MTKAIKRKSGRGVFLNSTPSPDRECFYCGEHLSPAKLTVDHVIPLGNGGSDHLNNKVACCFDCNQKKRDRMPTNKELAKLEAIIWYRKRAWAATRPNFAPR